jgi:HD-GYP domain-containing protein (c-di-GMP phosphodiesterase class II)
MRQVSVSDLRPGVIFDRPVFIDGRDVLLSAYQPLKASDYERLKSWGVQFVYTEGEILSEEDAEDELKHLVSDLVEKEGPDISDLYHISPTDLQDMNAAKKHLEMVEMIKNNFDLVRKGKFPDASELRNAANGLISFVNKNNRLIFKLILIPPKPAEDFLYYNGVNTALLNIFTGLNMKLSRLHLSNLAVGAFMHDIGMTRISDDIIYKKGKLTETEYNILRKHPFYGYQILQKSESFPTDVSLIVLQHHERLDGTGYPYGFQGPQISEFARITAVSDAYQAMCQQREYREAKTPPMIIKALLQEGLGKLDPNILKIFTYTVGVFPLGLMVEMTNGAVGEVMMQNIKALTKPVVKVYIDEKQMICEPPKVVNLMLKEDWEIKKVLTNAEREKILRKMGRK